MLSVADAELGFAKLDSVRFERSRETVFRSMTCLSDILQPEDISRIHALMGLAAFIGQDDALAVSSFRSALVAEHGYHLPIDLVPEEHPLRLQYVLAHSLTSAPSWSAPDLGADSLLIDGRSASEIPSDRPFLAQRLSLGQVSLTLYLNADGVKESLPTWLQAPDQAALAPDTRHPWALLGGAVLSAVTAGAFYGVAASRQASLLDDTTPYSDLQGLRTQANAFSGVALGCAALGVGFGTVAVIRW